MKKCTNGVIFEGICGATAAACRLAADEGRSVKQGDIFAAFNRIFQAANIYTNHKQNQLLSLAIIQIEQALMRGDVEILATTNVLAGAISADGFAHPENELRALQFWLEGRGIYFVESDRG